MTHRLIKAVGLIAALTTVSASPVTAAIALKSDFEVSHDLLLAGRSDVRIELIENRIFGQFQERFEDIFAQRNLGSNPGEALPPGAPSRTPRTENAWPNSTPPIVPSRPRENPTGGTPPASAARPATSTSPVRTTQPSSAARTAPAPSPARAAPPPSPVRAAPAPAAPRSAPRR